jgi:hypothetical protein
MLYSHVAPSNYRTIYRPATTPKDPFHKLGVLLAEPKVRTRTLPVSITRTEVDNVEVERPNDHHGEAVPRLPYLGVYVYPLLLTCFLELC